MPKVAARKKNKKDDILKLSDLIIDSIQDKKGEQIVRLDLRKIEDSAADFFIICSADATVQVKAIADHIAEKTKEKLNDKPWHIEGYSNLEWVLMDYVNIVVHIFIKRRREFYQLEDLWSDADIQKYE